MVYHVLTRCARYSETSCNRTRNPGTVITAETLEQFILINQAQIQYLQDEYASILVNSQFNTSTSKRFRALQKIRKRQHCLIVNNQCQRTLIITFSELHASFSPLCTSGVRSNILELLHTPSDQKLASFFYRVCMLCWNVRSVLRRELGFCFFFLVKLKRMKCVFLIPLFWI